MNNTNLKVPALLQLLLLCIAYSCADGINTQPDDFFYPGQTWLDTSGKPIEAHGGGLLLVNGTYYWYGENHQLGTGNKTGISCYSSADLFHWKNEGVVFPKDSLPEAYRDSGVCERPKVIFNVKTGKYVMWMHLDGRNYTLASAGVAVAEQPQGPFRFIRSFRPVVYDYGYRQSRGPEFDTRERKLGNTFRDMNLFQDTDGKAYVFYSSEDNASLYTVRLSSDFTKVDTPLVQGKNWQRILPDGYREAPAPFKHKGKYYLITSGLTGWAPNPASYHTADSILGPWKTVENPCKGPGAETTFRGQSTYVLPAPGQGENDFIFMADRWNGADLFRSTMVWLPFRIRDDGAISIDFLEKWNFSAFSENTASLESPVIQIKQNDASEREHFSLHWEKIAGAIAYRIFENGQAKAVTVNTEYSLPSKLAGAQAVYSVTAFNLDTSSAPSPSVTMRWQKSSDIWLSDVEPVSAKQGFSTLKYDVALEGGPLSIGGKVFEKGLGTHAVSEIVYSLDGSYSFFEAYTGVDDFTSFSTSPSVEFFLYGDNKLLWNSGLMYAKTAAKFARVNIKGIKELKLVVGDTGDGTHYDHADWGNARLLVK